MSEVPNNNSNDANDRPTSSVSHGPARAQQTDDDFMDASLEKEINDAMTGMSATDLAELCGPTTSPSATAEMLTPESVSKGARLTGVVAGVVEDEIFIEFGAKTQGVLPRSQFDGDDEPDVGTRISVIAERVDNESGLVTVRLEGSVQKADWDTIEVGSIVEGRATGMVKGGLELSINGLRAFMPGSQVALAPMKDISELLNEVLRCQVIEVNKRGKNLLVSRRKLLERERKENRAALWQELEVGQVRDGVVGNIKEFGAFVDLGGLDGLIHISDVSWGTVAKVADVLTPGQEVKVQVLKIDKKRNRISLGLKQVTPDPWNGLADRHPVGAAVQAKVIRLADFGAFAEIEPGVEALIPISELSWTRIRQASDAVAVGETVNCVVMRVEERQRRAALSVRQAKEDPWAGVAEAFPEKSVVKGKVTRLADFGVFVELTAGVEGLIHISELAEGRVRSCSDVVTVGQEVDARVLGVDGEERRISLSIRAVHDQPQDQSRPEAVLPKPKKRKKPLRGGLASHFEW